MADKKKYEDEEYHFAGDEGLESEEGFEPAETRAPPSSGTTMRRNLLVAVILILVILAVYKLMGMFFSPSSIRKTSLKPTEATKMMPSLPTTVSTPTTPPPTTSVVTTPEPEKAVVSTEQGASNHEINQKLNRVEIAVEGAKSDINSVSNSISDLKSSLNDLTSKISDLNNTVTTLSNQVSQQQQEIVLLKPKPKFKKMRHVRILHRARPSGMYLEAIIAGRAWLKSLNGTTLTVSEGTKIGGAGRVTIIDPQLGQVVLDSGEVIRFRPSER